MAKRLAAILLCFALCVPCFAAGENDLPPIMDMGDTEAEQMVPPTESDGPVKGPAKPEKNEQTAPDKQETPKIEEIPAQQEETPKQEDAPTTTGDGYASPIVNIEAIEVPLDDGTSIVLPFLDVPLDAYYTAAVAWAYSHDPQITGGVADDRFDPLATCTRGQMVTFLWRAAGCPEPTGAASAFSDVAAGAYYEKAVAWAVENGITTGMGDGKFDPNGIVNRAQTVTFLYRAKGKPAVTSAAQFTDVAAGEYYADAVAWAVANEVTNGVSDNSFAPNNNCVRGQTVTFLYRAYK
jgi:hypothetical protein